jgi:hypothetical protein
MVRPCKLDTVHFSRKLREPERVILLAAGAGDITQGFHFALAIYAHLHAQGFRPGDPLESIALSVNENALSIALDPGRAGR